MTRTPTLTDALNILNLYNVHQLHAELTALQPGQPRARHYDADRTTTGQGPADPTYNAATTPNQAAADLATYQRHVDQLYAACMGLAHLADRHVPTHEPRRGTFTVETKGCTLHERAGIDQHYPVWRTTDLASALPTPLRAPIALCRPCYDHAHRIGALPSPEEIIRHHRTGKWTQRTNPKARHFTVADIAATRPGDPAA